MLFSLLVFFFFFYCLGQCRRQAVCNLGKSAVQVDVESFRLILQALNHNSKSLVFWVQSLWFDFRSKFFDFYRKHFGIFIVKLFTLTKNFWEFISPRGYFIQKLATGNIPYFNNERYKKWIKLVIYWTIRSSDITGWSVIKKNRILNSLHITMFPLYLKSHWPFPIFRHHKTKTNLCRVFY